MLSMPQNAALIVIDVQKGFDDPQWGPRNNPDAEKIIATLLSTWRETARPVFHVQHFRQFAAASSKRGLRNQGQCATSRNRTDLSKASE
jgi:nicotinamidase-related amidase